jgi:uncharacterized membrane protein YagU involved in acid resistance
VERESGFVVGAIIVNIIVTFGALVLTIAVAIIATYPDLPVAPTLVAGLAVAVLLPVLAFPVSHTVWAALDLTMHPLDLDEVADASRHCAGADIQQDP